MPVKIRPVRVPEDMPRLVEIYNSISPEPVTIERWLGWEENPPEGRIRIWDVATVDDDYIVGYAGADRNPHMRPGVFHCYSRVHPDYRNRGIGEMLLRHVEKWAIENGAARLRGMVRDNHTESVTFAEKRGYVKDRHVYDSTLALATFDEAPFAAAIEEAAAKGFRFLSMADQSGEEIERKLYELIKRSVLDIPGNDHQGFEPFEHWRREEFGSKDFRPDCYFYAMKDDRVVGMTGAVFIEATGAMWTFYTAVHPDCRGNNLSLVLKLLSIRRAKEYGAAYMRTNNDSQNAPMLAVNRRLGYVPCPGQFRMERQV